MRVALYARVSTTKQAEKDLSIPDQLRQMHEHCSVKKYDVVAEFRDEGASATTDQRPQFLEMMAQIQRKELDVDAVLGLTTSRLFRNHEDAANWKRKLTKHRVRILSIDKPASDDDNPSTRLMDRMFAIIDEHESEMIGWHTHRGMRENARRGFWNGARPPFGYTIEKVHDERGNQKSILRVEGAEAKFVRRIFGMYVDDYMGATEIAKALNREGSLRRGKIWNSVEVLRVLENECYVGRYHYNRFDSRNRTPRPESEWITLDVPSIITEEVFEDAMRIRKEKTPDKTPGRVNDGPLLLTGLVRCGHCGSQMISAATKKKTKNGSHIYRYYACKRYVKSGKEACPGTRQPAEQLEAEVIGPVLDWMFSEDHVKQLVRVVRKALSEREKPAKKLRAQISDVDQRLERYYEAFESGALPAEQLAERVTALNGEKRELKRELSRRTTIDQLPAYYGKPEYVERVREELRAMFDNKSTQAQKRYLKLILEDITVTGNDIAVRPKGEGIIGTLESMEEAGSLGVTEVINRSNKWQPVCYAEHNFSKTFRLLRNRGFCKQLRFNPIQVAEWMADLLARGVVQNRAQLAQYLYVSRTRVNQYLALLDLPVRWRASLRYFSGLTEGALRKVVNLDSADYALAKLVEAVGGRRLDDLAKIRRQPTTAHVGGVS